MNSQAHTQTIKQVLKSYKVNPDKGLNNHQVKSRLEIYGKNKLKEKQKINPIKIFFSQFKSFIIYILLFAITIAFLAREYIDASVILSILILNAGLGFFQEYKAEKGIAALKKLSALKSTVLRNNNREIIKTESLVPGDIIIIEEGTRVPADARVIESITLHTLEASLTGESIPIEKQINALQGDISIADKRNMVFAGTIVTRGRGKAVVTGTGMKTEIGKIAGLISEVKKDLTPLQKKLESFGKYLGIGILIVSALTFIIGVTKEGLIPLLLSGNIIEFLFQSKEWLLTAIALAVAAVPEGLPAIVTITLAIGTSRMLKRNALIRKLPSVETLGDTTVICCDKTGTLTENEMTVRKAYVNGKEIKITGSGYEINGEIKSSPAFNKKDLFLFKIGALCNNANLQENNNDIKIVGDPTEAALLISAEKARINRIELKKSWKRVKEKPFDTLRKMMSTVNINPITKNKYVMAKGAPEVIIDRCKHIFINGRVKILTKEIRNKILEKNDEFAKNALRVLAFAYKEYKGKNMEKNLIFVGLQGMIDPPHKEVKESIKKCKEAGIKVLVLTGDNKHTAESIAKEIELTGKSIVCSDFSSLPRQEQIEILNDTVIFARAEPADKMTIIDLLQNKGETVAMTGDGVNDALAIKKADLGIAMGIKGTDIAKETSDITLIDDNFSTIVSAVEEGRGIKENIKKFVNYLLSSNLSEVFIILLAILLSWPLPMTAVMLLWLNLVTDGLPALALGIDPNPPDLMKKSYKKNSKIVNKEMITKILFISILITVGVSLLFYWAMNNYSNLENNMFISKIQTIAFTSLIMIELVRLQAIRSEYKLGIFSNKYLVFAVISSIALQLAVIYTPLSAFFKTSLLSLLDWAMILGTTAGIFLINLIATPILNKLSKN